MEYRPPEGYQFLSAEETSGLLWAKNEEGLYVMAEILDTDGQVATVRNRETGEVFHFTFH